jgi:hypothetical protein
MKYTVEMASDGKVYIPSHMIVGSGIQSTIKGITSTI